jgi:catechol 2,3-dioxygenase-like lactoylglutathione lyase family enzyme
VAGAGVVGVSWACLKRASVQVNSRGNDGDDPGIVPGVMDHIGLGVSNLAASRAFYERALAPLGIGVVMEVPGAAGFGREGKPWFWIGEGEASGPIHIAFAAPDRAAVDAFHREALAAGGRDNGEPGLREIYHPTYYGAFVLDPDGNNAEAVTHRPE